MKITYTAQSDTGSVRNHNEDYFAAFPQENLFIVADGMGGHAAGEVASRMAAEIISEFYERTQNKEITWPYKLDRSLSYSENRLVCSVRLANQKIFKESIANTKRQGMGTTIVTATMSENTLYIGHVGDSRAYSISPDRTICQLTRDHSLLEDFKEARPDVTEEETENFPHKNVITRALGMRETVQVDISSHELEPECVYLLCSDGLSGMLSDQQISKIICETATLNEATETLIQAANDAGGIDNITVLMFQSAA